MVTPTENRPCLGVLLAGGQSRRMGRDKALLDWQGQPLIERQLAALRASGVDGLRVSGERPMHGGTADAQPHFGPLGGLASVAATLTGEPDLLVMPVDMPRLSSGLLRRLRCENPAARSLRLAGHVLPWRVRLDAACRLALATLLTSDEPRRRSLHGVQHALCTAELALTRDEVAQLIDCNTPERWNEANR